MCGGLHLRTPPRAVPLMGTARQEAHTSARHVQKNNGVALLLGLRGKSARAGTCPCGCAAGPGLPRRTSRLRQRSAHVHAAPPQQAPTPGTPTERKHGLCPSVERPSARSMALGPTRSAERMRGKSVSQMIRGFALNICAKPALGKSSTRRPTPGCPCPGALSAHPRARTGEGLQPPGVSRDLMYGAVCLSMRRQTYAGTRHAVWWRAVSARPVAPSSGVTYGHGGGRGA
jgi:hypothetical protein